MTNELLLGLLTLAIVAVGTAALAIIRLRLSLSKALQRNRDLVKTAEANRTSVMRAREILKRDQERLASERASRLPSFMARIPTIQAANEQDKDRRPRAWLDWKYAYAYRPGDLQLSHNDSRIIDILRSPGSDEDIASRMPSVGPRIHQRLQRLEQLGLLESLDGNRFVATHEAHVHALMSVPEGVVFSHISRKPSKCLRLDRFPGDHQGESGVIRSALDGLCEKGYLTRHGSTYRMIPMPASRPKS